MELDYKAIGKRIKIARIKADMTQEMLAEKIELSPTHLSNICFDSCNFNSFADRFIIKLHFSPPLF